MPDEPVPTLGEKEYQVVGPRTVLGNEPGAKFKADLTAEQESFYVDGGHLKVVEKKGGKTDG